MTALDPSKQGIEAQKLISISLGKMAASRVGKGGSSLHKSLLVASVLQRARHVFLEENYHNYHYRGPATITPVPMYAPHVPPPPPPSPAPPAPQDNNENRCATPYQHQQGDVSSPVPVVPRVPLSDASNQQHPRSVALKRRRCVSDKETQEAVSSILPKRFKGNSENTSPYEEVEEQSQNSPQENVPSRECCTERSQLCEPGEYLLVPIPVSENSSLTPTCETGYESSDTTYPDGAPRDTTNHSNPIYCTLEPISDDEEDDDDAASSMEVEHITSLVSIFSFGAPRKDLCATQAAREDHSQFTPVALAV